MGKRLKLLFIFLLTISSYHVHSQELIDKIVADICDCVNEKTIQSREDIMKHCFEPLSAVYGSELETYLRDLGESDQVRIEKLGLLLVKKMLVSCEDALLILSKSGQLAGFPDVMEVDSSEQNENDVDQLFNSFGKLKARKGDYIHVLEHEEAGMVDDYYVLQEVNGDTRAFKGDFPSNSLLLIWWFWKSIYSAKTESLENVRVITDLDVFPEQDVCNPLQLGKNFEGISLGSRKVFQTGDVYFTTEFDEEWTEINGTKFVKRLTYNLGNVSTFYFTEKKDGIYYLEPDSLTLTLDVPFKPHKGKKWQDVSGDWEYEIKETSAEFKTPECTYQSCLVIKATMLNLRDEDGEAYVYENYYLKGFGYIGSTLNGDLTAHLVGYDMKTAKAN